MILFVLGSHMGPPRPSGKSLDQFVILEQEAGRERGEHDSSDNPVVIINNSAQFSRMSIDFHFCESRTRGRSGNPDFICTLFIEGKVFISLFLVIINSVII